jgi:hypothetical protein
VSLSSNLIIKIIRIGEGGIRRDSSGRWAAPSMTAGAELLDRQSTRQRARHANEN